MAILDGWYRRRAEKLIEKGDFHTALGLVKKISDIDKQKEIISSGLHTYSLLEVKSNEGLSWTRFEGEMRLRSPDGRIIPQSELYEMCAKVVTSDNPLMEYYLQISNGVKSHEQ